MPDQLQLFLSSFPLIKYELSPSNHADILTITFYEDFGRTVIQLVLKSIS